MEERIQPFDFKQSTSVIRATGKKAGDIREFRDVIAEVSGESIFHHTYQYFLKGHILEYTNDFAQWAGMTLEERGLSEMLSSIDPFSYLTIDELRRALLKAIDDYLMIMPEPRQVRPGDEFYFNESISLVFPAGVRAKNLAEFLMAVKYVDLSSIYYHFIEARVRHVNRTDDFSEWIRASFGKNELAERLRAIDIFMHSVERIRDHIAAAIEEELQKDMYSSVCAVCST